MMTVPSTRARRRLVLDVPEESYEPGTGRDCGLSCPQRDLRPRRGTGSARCPDVGSAPREGRLMTGSTGGFELRGINHLALVCRDMERTVDFYTNVLGMPLVKTIELPADMGQHFFFNCGGRDCLAFFWFPNAPDGVPGISAPAARPDQGDLTSAIGSMNHVAFDVAPEKIEEYRDRLIAAGVDCTEIANHDDSEWGISDTMHPGVYVRSIYFQDPDGILLEFACWLREFNVHDVSHTPTRTIDANLAAE